MSSNQKHVRTIEFIKKWGGLGTERNSMELFEILVMIMVRATVTNMGRGN